MAFKTLTVSRSKEKRKKRGQYWHSRLKLTDDTTETLPAPDDLGGMTFVGAILWRASLESGSTSRARRRILKNKTCTETAKLLSSCLGVSQRALCRTSVLAGRRLRSTPRARARAPTQNSNNFPLPVRDFHNKRFQHRFVPPFKG